MIILHSLTVQFYTVKEKHVLAWPTSGKSKVYKKVYKCKSFTSAL